MTVQVKGAAQGKRIHPAQLPEEPRVDEDPGEVRKLENQERGAFWKPVEFKRVTGVNATEVK